MSEAKDLICSHCHARVASEIEACPACGGVLTTDPMPAPRLASGASRDVDHRGILLPPRHAVGGVITPR